MKKTLIAFAVGLSFLSYLSVSAATETNFASSGIDLDASTVKIEYTAASGAGAFSCLSSSSSPQTHTFTAAGWNSGTGNFDNFNEASGCFQAAGDYTVTTTVIDKAGNTAAPLVENFTIKPGNVDNNNSDLNGSCVNGIADFNEQCAFNLVLKDKYGNTITIQEPKVLSDTGEFGDDANKGIKFRGGLRVKGNGAFGGIPSAGGVLLENNKDFYLRAISPSIEKVGEVVIGVLNPLGKWLSLVTDRTINFVFTNLKSVNNDGTLGVSAIADFEKTKDLTFKNPFYVKPEVAGITLSEPFDIDIVTDREVASGSEPIVSGKVYIENVARDSSDSLEKFCDENDENCSVFSEHYNDTFPAIPNTKTYTKKLAEPEGSTFDPNRDYVDLITEIEYQLDSATIRYPAGAAGNAFSSTTAIGVGDGVDAKFIGADIEGIVRIADEKVFLGQEGDSILNIGMNSGETDLYEKVVKNGWELVRNAEKKQDNNVSPVSLTGLFQKDGALVDVVVIDLKGKKDGDEVFSIQGNPPTGNHTLILVDGNLRINGNMEYTNTGDSFGVIVLRSQAGPYPAVGNIFVSPTIQKIVGSYFADGGFMNNGTDDVTKGNETPSTYQLLLNGALFSSNTLGGSYRNAGGNTDYTPWEDDASQILAETYDLDYVRRYDSTIHSDGTHNIPLESNNSAFIIRQDGKAASNPPPGFRAN